MINSNFKEGKKAVTHVSLQAEPGKIRPVRISLGTDTLAHKTFPAADDFDSLEEAVAFADSVNKGKGPDAKDCDVIRLYDDQGEWVGGHCSIAPGQQEVTA